MRSFFIVRQVPTNPIGHHQDQCAIVHIQPIGSSHELIVVISYERAVNILAQVWLKKLCHDIRLNRFWPLKDLIPTR